MMNLTGTQKARFLCKTNVLRGDIDVMGNSAGLGAACSTCQGCDSPAGQLGLVGERTRLIGSVGEIKLAWDCPSCGCEVVEATTALSAYEDASAVEQDPLCCRCRRKPQPGLTA